MSDVQNKDAVYLYATIGSLTARGGRVTTAKGGAAILGLGLACVSDVVTYPDGSEAVNVNKAGCSLVIDGRPAALVGSGLSNGDRIIETLQQEHGLTSNICMRLRQRALIVPSTKRP